jgi:RHS repeat-associated protein
MPVAIVKPANTFYIHTDYMNTPRQISNANRDPVWAWEPQEFGANAPNTDPTNSGTHFSYILRFPGQFADQEPGLRYNYARDYDPSVGRYVESDPIGLLGGINSYAYVGANPVSRIDRLGLCASDSNQHNYDIQRATLCSAAAAFSMLLAPGMSAPGAPAAQEGFTPQIVLAGNNPISQSVNSSTMTIVNTTLPSHSFYPEPSSFK